MRKGKGRKKKERELENCNKKREELREGCGGRKKKRWRETG